MLETNTVLRLKRTTYSGVKSSTHAVLFVVVFLFLLGAFFLFCNITYLLTHHEKPARSDAIVILLGGIRPERVKQAKLLLNHSIAPYVVFGSGFKQLKFHWTSLPQYHWSAAGDRYMRQLLALGVQGSKIIEVPTPQAFDSESEILQLLVFIRAKKWNKIMLVTSASHSRRAKMIWDRLAPDIAAAVIAAPDLELRHWWKSRQGIATVTHELLGYIKEIGRRVGIFPSFVLTSKND